MRRWQRQQQQQQQQQQQKTQDDNYAEEQDEEQQQSSMMEEESAPSLSNLVIQSANTLQETETDLTIPQGWSGKPPVLTGPRGQADSSHHLLKGVIRQGIPPALRCAMWLSNIIQAVHPHQPEKYWHEYRTLAKVRSLDFAYEALLRTMVSAEDANNTGSNSTDIATTAAPSSASSGSIFALTNEIWKHRQCPTYGRSTAVTSSSTSTTSDDNEAQNNSSSSMTTATPVQDLIPGITTRGAMAQKRVLIALERVVLGMVEYAPLLPIICALLLMTMSESYAFTAIREMSHDTKWYFPITRREHQAHARAFAHVLFKLHPQTAEYLQDRGVLDEASLQSIIFTDFFLGILPLPLVLRIMDIYTLEGSKVLFRIGVSLCVLYRREAAEQLVTISNAAEWWQTMKHWTHYKSFNFNVVLRKAYGVHGKVLQNQLRFPSRAIIQRIIKAEEEHLLFQQEGINHDDDDNDHDNNSQHGGDASSSPHGNASPLGLATGPPELIQSGLSNTTELVQRVLAAPLQTRQLLANWLPLTMRLTNLDLIYSTNYHGRDLDIFFSRVKNARHSILLAEVLQNDNDKQQQQQQSSSTVIGMYASQAWRVSNQVYGDGECFLFRLSPNPHAWKWRPDKETTRNSIVNNNSNNNNSASATVAAAWDIMNNSNNSDALLHQFMVSTLHYISMGGNADGSCGLRINQDLTRGESSTAAGFGNEPLHGTNRGSVFELGLVEVYGFVRQIDGKPV